MAFWLTLMALAGGVEAEPTDHEVIYYNARLALREGRALDATKLWLLRNAHEDATGRVSRYDDDFRSVTWAALGELGVCQDGHRVDKDGAGLWPLALHNWVVRNRMRRAGRDRPNPYKAFEVDRQHRFIAITDVLSAEELRTVSVFRGRCWRPFLILLEAGELPTARLKDRQVAARVMRFLLERSKSTLADDVRGTAAVDARLFDVNLQLMALAAQEARRKAREQGRIGRGLGLERPSVQVMRTDAPGYTFGDSSEPARILRASTRWPASEWLALSPDRRLFLMDHAQRYLGQSEDLDRLKLDILDALIAAGDGEQVEAWIARWQGPRQAIWAGDRGRRLLALDDEAGFDARGVIALHRGVDQLQRGEIEPALRSLATAVQFAAESDASGDIRSLSVRWLSYVAAQFEISDTLLVTLQELVPRREYSVILEDLMWSAAFRSDRASFEHGLANQVGRGALGRRLALLVPLANGDANGFVGGIATGLAESPGETLRFLDQLVQRLELEDADVRGDQRAMLVRLRRMLAPLADPTSQDRSMRRAAELQRRTLAVLEGIGGVGDDGSLRDRARALAPDGEVFAGSVRLAPSDPLPWPFEPIEVTAPSIFAPLDLNPVEWRGDDGEWVFGWSIEG